jgi:hypothetical protein
MLWRRRDNSVNILPNWVVGHYRQMPKRGRTGDASLRQYDPMNESWFQNSMNNHHADRERGVGNWGGQRMGRIEENSFLCPKSASVNWEKISVGGMPGESGMNLLLFEVCNVTRERQWRKLSRNSIFAGNDLHQLREMNKPTRSSCVVSHGNGNGELRQENAWQSSDGREELIAFGRHCFTQVLLGQPIVFNANWSIGWLLTRLTKVVSSSCRFVESEGYAIVGTKRTHKSKQN